jgi:hypothetical protein
MDSRNHPQDRKLSDAFSCRFYEDNFEHITKIAQETKSTPREVVRDIVDEALRMRLNPPAERSNEEIIKTLSLLVERIANERDDRYERLFERYEQLVEQQAKLKQGLVAQVREFAGILSEMLAAAIGARRLTWNYVAYNALKRSGYSDSQIAERHAAENKAWNAERDTTVKEIKGIIKKSNFSSQD